MPCPCGYSVLWRVVCLCSAKNVSRGNSNGVCMGSPMEGLQLSLLVHIRPCSTRLLFFTNKLAKPLLCALAFAMVS